MRLGKEIDEKVSTIWKPGLTMPPLRISPGA